MTAGMTGDKVRLDRWLWAARFFKTRSVAARAIDGGKVQVNGARVKRSMAIHVGDTLRITKSPFELTVVVRALSEHRGSASVAETLYEETPASREAREQLRLQLKYQPQVAYDGRGRPTKKDRRQLDRFKREV